jgi:DNA repair protein RadC
MSQISLSLDTSLLIRDITGDYRPANADEMLQAAQRLLGAQLRGHEVMSSPQAVRDFLRVKLGGLEHEVFAVLMLDAQNRLIEYVELFRGTVSQASVYPREVVNESLGHLGQIRPICVIWLSGRFQEGHLSFRWLNSGCSD